MCLRVLWHAVVVVVAAASLSSCGTTSVEDVEARVDDGPGVVRVSAWQEPAPDVLPFVVQVPISVRVVMEDDAPEAEILGVFEAYAGDIDNEVVAHVEVVLPGPARTSILETGAGVHAAEDTVRDLLDAQHDPTIARYRREMTPTLFGEGLRVVDSVDVKLASGGFDDVVAAVDHYRNIEGIGPVSVRSGGFKLSVDEDGKITKAKVQLIRETGNRFGLRMAKIGLASGMTLWVDAADLPAAARYVRRTHDPYAVGWVDVQAYR